MDQFRRPARYRKWIKETISDQGKTLARIGYHFISDDALHALNVRHLEHDTLTDILTFPYSENPIEAEIFISVDRVSENAQDNATPFLNELRRVMIHGVLHMCGWQDHTPQDKTRMRAQEDHYLSRW